MKKKIRAVLAAVAAGALLGAFVPSASAGELSLWEQDNYAGYRIVLPHCNADFQDNIYDSGKQNLVSYVTIWNNTVFAGDRAIAKIKYNQGVSVFNPANAADHATCYG